LEVCGLLGDEFVSIFVLHLVGVALLGLGEAGLACQVWREALTLAQAFTPAHPQAEMLRQRLSQNRCPEA
ncbi:MAG: hypothetical protein JNK29_06495, partial [Anaerolineales bacterium]|nr:hypothetical protein [Anaerolineales bacterium]